MKGAKKDFQNISEIIELPKSTLLKMVNYNESWGGVCQKQIRENSRYTKDQLTDLILNNFYVINDIEGWEHDEIDIIDYFKKVEYNEWNW